MTQPFILASASPRRLALLQQIGIEPTEIVPADIDETPRKGELPRTYASRMSHEKAARVAEQRPMLPVLGADTVVACGRRILPKATTAAEARHCLGLLSGRRHRVYTSVTLHLPKGPPRHKLVVSTVKFQPLSPQDITWLIDQGDWHDKAGGYALQGAAAAFIPFVQGSVSGVIGLPLWETRGLIT